jgi:hypothetical protein
MSETRILELPVAVYEAVVQAAETSGTTIADLLGQRFGVSGDLSSPPPLSLLQRRAFLNLPMEERRRILAEQAEKAAPHYEQDNERTGP